MKARAMAPSNKPKRRSPKVALQEWPLAHLIPNAITFASLCAGMTAIKFALDSLWELSLVAIIIAAILDSLDGRMARLLNKASKFGAELDSLADFLNYGAAPVFIMYEFTLHKWGQIGWSVGLFYTMCCCFRLARFNALNITQNKETPWMEQFFMGASAPMGALVALAPMMAFVEIDATLPPFLAALSLIVCGSLMASRVPTFSLKGRSVPRVWVMPLIGLIFFLVVALISHPFVTIPVLSLLYLAAIPFSYRSFKNYQAMEKTR